MKPRATIKPFEDRMLDVLGDPRGQIYRERGAWYYVPSCGCKMPIPIGTNRRDVVRECSDMMYQLRLEW
jgi:hypothetical protein